MPLQVLQRPLWNGEPIDLQLAWIMRTSNNLARCTVSLHVFGWELRLEAAGELVRSEVCREQEAVLDALQQCTLRWKRKAGDSLKTSEAPVERAAAARYLKYCARPPKVRPQKPES